MSRAYRFSAVAAGLVFCAAAHAFDAGDIISPSPGTWANRQALVLDVSDGSELYYSLAGSDPLVSGFSYDGPVLIGLSGNVSLSITALSPDGVRSDFFVEYSVVPSSAVFEDPDESLFVQEISSNPVRKYTSGATLSIPPGFAWGMGTPVSVRWGGTELSVAEDNSCDRYVACTVSDGTDYWHFVLHVVPSPSAASTAESAGGASVPFELDDAWSTFTFTGQKLIYQLDDAFWSASTAPVRIDRSVPHTVRWQSMDYEFGNPVSEAVIPAKPALSVFRRSDGSCVIEPEGEGFLLGSPHTEGGTLGVSVQDAERVVVDVFDDDSVSGNVRLSVSYGGVYQGDAEVFVSLDRKIPEVPVISSSAKDSYARDRVRLSISGVPGARIFYAVSEPLVSDSGFSQGSEAAFAAVTVGNFSLYGGQEIVLSSLARKATYYKVVAYAEDDAGNRSAPSEYHVAVDEFNFYMAPGRESSVTPDGSFAYPFTSFSQAEEALSESSFMRLHLLGDMTLPEGDTVMRTSCTLVGSGSRIIIPENARIVVQGSDFAAEGCVFEREAGQFPRNATSGMFVVSGGSLSLSDCEVVGTFQSNGILIDASASLVSLSKTGLTVQGSSYAAVLSCAGTDVSISGSRLTAVAQMAVGASVNGSTLLVSDSSVTLISSLARGVELVDSVARLSNSGVEANLDGAGRGSSAVWKDVDSLVSFEDFRESGF